MLEIIKQEAQWPPESTAVIRHENDDEREYLSLNLELSKNELVYMYKANVIWNMDETFITLATDAENCWKVQKHMDT